MITKECYLRKLEITRGFNAPCIVLIIGKVLFKAKEYYKKACDLNSTAGCSDLALLKYGLATNTSHDSSNSQNNLNDFESLSKKACLDMKRTQSSEYIYKYILGKADGCFQVGQAKE